jgi:3-deoxy-D-manno-octulosonate 8-phosphate phosphatase (KDO 8-P phosphatase)
VALDVDGVLTDGGFYWGANGEEFKRFSFADVMGVSLARKAGLAFALISGEASPLVDRYAAKMGITAVHKGCKDKAAALSDFAAALQVPLKQVCFVGDDVNDLPAMRIAGLSAAPCGAHADVLGFVDIVMTHSGGNGAVRELLDAIVAAKNT